MAVVVALFAGFVVMGVHVSALVTAREPAPVGSPQEAPKMPDVIVLAKENKLGPVTFHHADHTTKPYNVAGTGPIACVECHHTAQPASEAAKNPLLKTAWPADRTTTLTAELFAKDPNAVGPVACRECHARAGTTPTLMPAIPTLKVEGSDTTLTLTNQLAFHRNCATCHAEVAKARPDTKAPGPQKCTRCHMK